MQGVDERGLGPWAVDDRLHRDRHDAAGEHRRRREEERGRLGARRSATPAHEHPHQRDDRRDAERERPEHGRDGGPHRHPPRLRPAVPLPPGRARAIDLGERRPAGDDGHRDEAEERRRDDAHHDIGAADAGHGLMPQVYQPRRGTTRKPPANRGFRNCWGTWTRTKNNGEPPGLAWQSPESVEFPVISGISWG